MKRYFIISFLSLAVLSCKKKEKDQNQIIESPYPKQVTDIEGNKYKTVKIGTQIWMAENLKTTKYSNGTSIPNITDNIEWTNLTTGAYCNYENNVSYGTTDGKLYNWSAANNSNVCPTGWHLPSISEWQELSNFLGGDYLAGKKLKSDTAIFDPYLAPNGSNETGFNAIPSGSRYIDGNFSMRNSFAIFWSKTEVNSINVNYTSLNADDDLFFGIAKKTNAFSIRCVQD
jgi:uncharacterized protein (TIGR02145 family)